jgi:hypothetical protein
VVGFTASGISDVLARALAAKLEVAAHMNAETAKLVKAVKAANVKLQ